jgi:hypothetical protein
VHESHTETADPLHLAELEQSEDSDDTGCDELVHLHEGQGDSDDPLNLAEHERQQSDAQAIRSFLAAVSDCQAKSNQPQRQLRTIHAGMKRYRTRLPPILPKDDNRFGIKTARVFICDSCGNRVNFSSQQRGATFRRIECDFAGSYVDTSWSDIPGMLQRRAWEDRLIDATWNCSQFCGAPMTGVNPERRKARTEAWQQAQSPKRH